MTRTLGAGRCGTKGDLVSKAGLLCTRAARCYDPAAPRSSDLSRSLCVKSMRDAGRIAPRRSGELAALAITQRREERRGLGGLARCDEPLGALQVRELGAGALAEGAVHLA